MKELFGDKEILDPQNNPEVITIEGPYGAYKTTLATNFLYTGLTQGESGLFFNLNDKTGLNPRNNKKGWMDKQQKGNFCKIELDNGMNVFKSQALAKLLKNLDDSKKFSVAAWEYANTDKKEKSFLVEIALKTGALLPEELL
ncbi:MAG: hypothetical protein ACYC4Q_11020, partial [Victivallaceae bacterium]